MTGSDAFGAVLGNPVRYRDIVPDAEWQAGLVRTGSSAEHVAGLAALYRNYRAEAESELATGIQEVLGRPPRSAADFASDVLARGFTGGTWRGCPVLEGGEEARQLCT
ncbi:hypothetical protein AB0L13_13195 [Saccharopolyspora shandongensis]|uniref:hypothetical protein n=1 Tax=Saccharopolyspora shandongensis TaxID=418495 RepID=UPI003449994D